jgi:hypothetical protein
MKNIDDCVLFLHCKCVLHFPLLELGGICPLAERTLETDPIVQRSSIEVTSPETSFIAPDSKYQLVPLQSMATIAASNISNAFLGVLMSSCLLSVSRRILVMAYTQIYLLNLLGMYHHK